MNKFANILTAIAVCSLITGCGVQATDQPSNPSSAERSGNAPVAAPYDVPHWDYDVDGPARWGSLNKAWAKCAEGKAQSPIDIHKTSASRLPELDTRFRPAELKIVHNEHIADAVNNGHTIQINHREGDTLTIGDDNYTLKQYHFHGPSEHTIDGKHFPMEMHMVHQSQDGELAVVGVLIEEGKQHNSAFGPVWTNLPKSKGTEVHLKNVQVDVNQLLPKLRTTYRYDGSLTTPPCSENVKWIVFANPIEASSAQIRRFEEMIEPNSRSTQPLNGRVVVTDKLNQ